MLSDYEIRFCTFCDWKKFGKWTYTQTYPHYPQKVAVFQRKKHKKIELMF